MRENYKLITSRSKLVLAGMLVVMLLSSCGKRAVNTAATVDSTFIPPVITQLPALTGKLLYHTYVDYGEASKMYIYDFSHKKLSCISCTWNLYDPINGHFSPDGSQLVFMAQAVPGGKWDIYRYRVGSADNPVNLTRGDGSRDEDPKFSADGKSICFKKTISGGPGNIVTMSLDGTVLNHVTNNSIESSMPYFLPDGSWIIYAGGAGATSDIYQVNVDGTNNHPIQKISNLQEYYPIVIDSSTYLFSRWFSVSNHNDQVYLGYFSGAPSIPMLFNTTGANYSDAYPYGKDYVFVSSTRTGTVGAYDLYLADRKTGNVVSLSLFDNDINTEANELGACYSAD
jgi:Tol biopolymer transport system component